MVAPTSVNRGSSSLIERADGALYKAKREGRNRGVAARANGDEVDDTGDHEPDTPDLNEAKALLEGLK